MIKIQSIVFPKSGICYVPDMCYRLVSVPQKEHTPYHFDAAGQCLIVDQGGIVFFDTYFNGLSVGKWKKYTSVTGFALSLDILGSFSVSLLHTKYINGVTVQKVLSAEVVEAHERKTVIFPFPDCEAVGAISFRVDSLEDGGVLFGGGYYAEAWEQVPRDIELALNFCNYEREEYIYRNMDNIRRYILDDPTCELREHLQIFVADNSRTVDPARLPENRSHVFPQGDFGGAGGFTRGLMEVLRDKDRFGLTHAVMLDDDILLEPESLVRLFAFLRFMRPEHWKAFVGGALLRMDHQYIQVCQGGEWDQDNYYVFHKEGADLTRLRDVLLNEIENGAKINGWWFHCIPLLDISLDDLPYPFFFHMDDVEFDLRNCRQVIHMNGICTWHEPFEYKPGSHLFYYNNRNTLITHMLHFPEYDAKRAKAFLTEALIPLVFTYRYKEADLVMRGIEDAMRGPNWLVTQDPEALLEDVLSQGYKKQELDALPMRLDYGRYMEKYNEAVFDQPVETKRHRFWRRLCLNGYLGKAKRDVIVSMYFLKIRSVYRAKRVLNYDPVSERGFVTEKSYKELFRLFKRYLGVRRLLSRRFKKARQEYLDAFPSMTNSTFWYQYLGVTQEREGGAGV